MILLKMSSGALQINVDSQGWATVPNDKYILYVSEDRLTGSIRSTNSYLFEIENYLISDIVDYDNGNQPFDADTLEAYLIAIGFFSNGGGVTPFDPGFGAGVKLTTYSNIDQSLDKETKVLQFSQPDISDPPFNAIIEGVNNDEIVILSEGYVNASIEVNIERSGGFTQEVYFYIEGLPPAPLPQVWAEIPQSGRIFNFVSFSQGTKVFNFGGYINVNSFKVQNQSSYGG